MNDIIGHIFISVKVIITKTPITKDLITNKKYREQPFISKQ